jgi:hypothetical protein
MAEITKDDYLNLHSAFNDMLSEIAVLIISAAMVEVKQVDSHVLLEVTQKYSDELKKLTAHIVGE